MTMTCNVGSVACQLWTTPTLHMLAGPLCTASSCINIAAHAGCPQGAVFLYTSMTIRRMAQTPWPGFGAEGALWFSDLTLPALVWGSWETPMGLPGFILPAAVTAMMLTSIHIGFKASGEQWQWCDRWCWCAIGCHACMCALIGCTATLHMHMQQQQTMCSHNVWSTTSWTMSYCDYDCMLQSPHFSVCGGRTLYLSCIVMVPETSHPSASSANHSIMRIVSDTALARSIRHCH